MTKLPYLASLGPIRFRRHSFGAQDVLLSDAFLEVKY